MRKEFDPTCSSRREFLKVSALGGASLLAGCQNGAVENSNTQTQTTNKTNLPNITHRKIQTNGINMNIGEAGAGFPVVFLHGFAELWYSWRHQLPAIAAAGFHAVAPDLRGFGQPDVPPEIESYSTKNRAADVVGLLDALNAEKCVLVGNDWGSGLAWAIAQQERAEAVNQELIEFLNREIRSIKKEAGVG